jgi:hypothetical protein
MKIKLVDDARQVWRYSTMVLVYHLGVAATVWLTLSEAQQQAILALLGLTPEEALGFGALAVAVATGITRHTQVVK